MHEESLSKVLAEADAITAEAAGRPTTTAAPVPEPAELPTIDAHAPLEDDDRDDPELAAYNRALAALAEEDNRAG